MNRYLCNKSNSMKSMDNALMSLFCPLNRCLPTGKITLEVSIWYHLDFKDNDWKKNMLLSTWRLLLTSWTEIKFYRESFLIFIHDVNIVEKQRGRSSDSRRR